MFRLPIVAVMSTKRKIKRNSAPRCTVPGCKRRSDVTHECITCEKLGKEPIFTVHGCIHHKAAVLVIIKRHALGAHKINILKATAHALAGDISLNDVINETKKIS